MMSLAVSEKKIASSSALKSTPTKLEGEPVMGRMMSSWEERLNGMPLTASWLENSRKCLTAEDRKERRRKHVNVKYCAALTLIIQSISLIAIKRSIAERYHGATT